jgi:general secretion pathway protein D
MTMKPVHLTPGRLPAPDIQAQPARRALALALACALAAPALPVRAADAVLQPPPAPSKARPGSRTATVTLNFVSAEIDGVTRAIAAILDRNIVVDPRVKGTMTLYSEQPLTPREAYLNYLAALRGLGYTVVEVAGLMKVVPEADAKLQTGTVSIGTVTRTGDQIITQIFRLQHENANNLVPVLRPLISPNNTINANPGNNSLVITDYADNLNRIAKIIATMDTPSSTDVEVIPVQYAAASDLLTVVQRFADASAGAAAGAAPAGAITVLADARTNTLMIRAPNAARLAMVRSLIEKLDRPSGNAAPGGNIYVVYLKNADAVKLASVLRAAYSAGGSGSGGGGSSAVNAQAPITAGANAGASPQAAAPVQASAAPSTGGFIQADPATNSLIITAPEPVYRQLRAVIEQLDARRAQVYVESMIVKMDATQAADFGFQWQGLLGRSGDKYGIVAGTNFNAGQSGSSGTNNIIDLAVAAGSSPVTAAAIPGAGLNVGLIKAINGIYTLGALARFLESNTGANILSTPNLVSLDNEEAKIVIGQNVPFVTGSFTSTGTSSASVNPFQTVERKDVGLTLRVKPQIGESGTVRMTIYQENSSVVPGSGSTNGPTTDKSSIETTVVVDDGQIMVLGGLLQDAYNDNEDRVPGLASIPLIGNLFRSEARTRKKTNLLVFLRPVVMRTQAQADALTADRYDVIRAQMQGSQPRPSVVMPVNESPVLPERKPGGPATGADATSPATRPDDSWGKPLTPAPTATTR